MYLKYLVISVLLLSGFPGSARHLAIEDSLFEVVNGKYVLEGSIQSSYDPESLCQTMRSYVDSNNALQAIDSSEGFRNVRVKGHFEVPSYQTFTKYPDGVIWYDMTLHMSANTCKYYITDLIFQPYKRNRYGRFELVSGKYVPLEKNASKLNQKSWQYHREKAKYKLDELVNRLIKELKISEN